MTQMILCSVGVFLGVLYGMSNIVHVSLRNDVPASHVVLTALGWAIFTLGMFWRA